MPSRKTRRELLLVSLVLAAWTLLVFLPSLDGAFLRYDDEAYVTRNPVVQTGLNAESVRWALSLHAETVYWHPLTWLSHMLDVDLFGMNPRGHHAGNVLLHCLSTILLFLVLHRMTRALWASALVAALFALHPLHVESVCWIAERKDVLSAFFWMATLAAYAAYVEKPGAGRYAAVLGAFLLGLMAKPMLVTLPFVLLLLDYWPLGRLTRSALPRLLLEKAPLLVLAVVSAVATFAVQKDLGAVSLLEEIPLGFRIGNALASYGAYVGKTLWPGDLAAFYPHPGRNLELWRVAAGAAVLVAVTGFVIRQRRHRYLTAGWLWFLGTLIPVIGLVQAGDQAMADRFTYIPLIGLFMMIAWGVPRFLPGRVAPRARTLLLGTTALGALLALSVVTSFQIRTWRDSIALWSRAVQVTEGNYFAHNNLGQALNDAGRYEEAAQEYRAAIRLNPNWPEGLSNLGNALAKLGRIDEAVAQYRAALDLKYAQTGGAGDENTGVIHYSLGLALAEARKPGEAKAQFERAILRKPDFAAARYALGKQLEILEDYPAAAAQYREALRIEPRMIPARNNLAVVLYFAGDYAGAWRAVADCRALGFEPPRGFLEALSARMTDPAGR